MRRIVLIGLALTVFFFLPMAQAGDLSCFQPDGTSVDPATYREQARRHNAEVARIRAGRGVVRKDDLGRPLMDARGIEIRYTRMDRFDTRYRPAVPGHWAARKGLSVRASGQKKEKFRKQAKSGEAFMLGKDSYQTAKNMDKQLYDRAFRRAMATGDMSALRNWKKGHFRRKQGLLTREDYKTLGKK